MKKLTTSTTSTVFTLLVAGIAGCGSSSSVGVIDAASTIYSRGSGEAIVTAKLDASPARVYDAINQLAEQEPGVVIGRRDDQTMTLELTKEEMRYTLRAAEYDEDETLLFVWYDTGASDRSARDAGLAAIQRICDELHISYELIEP